MLIPFFANDSLSCASCFVPDADRCLNVCLTPTTNATTAFSQIPAERFKDDKAELYEEPTIAEMEAAIAAEDADLDQDRADADASSEDGSFDFEPMEDLDLQLNPTTTAATAAKPAKRKTPPSKPSALKKAKK